MHFGQIEGDGFRLNGTFVDLCPVITLKCISNTRTVETTRNNSIIFRGTTRVIPCAAVFPPDFHYTDCLARCGKNVRLSSCVNKYISSSLEVLAIPHEFRPCTISNENNKIKTRFSAISTRFHLRDKQINKWLLCFFFLYKSSRYPIIQKKKKINTHTKYGPCNLRIV